MKKTICYLGIATLGLLFASCGGSKENKNKEEVVASENAPAAATPAADPIALGEALVKASDCKTCHARDTKIIGPAHLDVAKKYEFTQANVTLLASKISKGGAGVWGQIPMSAHPNLSTADAEKMARYVLSLDGEKEH